MLKVIIADDQDLIRESLKIVLDINEDIQVVGVACNGMELLQLLEKQPADIILMDVRMPQLDGVQATKAVKEKYPATKIIILTTFDDDEYVFNGLKYGASGYLLKGISVPDSKAERSEFIDHLQITGVRTYMQNESINPDKPAEKDFLAGLAGSLGLDAELVANIDAAAEAGRRALAAVRERLSPAASYGAVVARLRAAPA